MKMATGQLNPLIRLIAKLELQFKDMPPTIRVTPTMSIVADLTERSIEECV